MNNDNESIRVVIADGDALARRTLRDALQHDGLAVIAEATSGDEAVALTAFYHPDVVVIDVRVPGTDGIAATAQIQQRSPNARVVLLAESPDDAVALRAIRAGASGYLSRNIEPDVLPRVVRSVVDGEAGVSRRLAMHLLEAYQRTPRVGRGLRPVRSTLTDREWEVLDLVAAGASTDEIAATLVLSTETVRSHLKNLYRKLGVRSREEASEAAWRLRELVV
jgi:NarL family two-component system response regulator LiaR